MKKAISGNNIPKAVGPYSAALRIGNTIYTSGQIPLDVNTGELVNSNVTDATRVIFSNIKSILESENYSFNDIVKVTVFSTNMDYFAEFNEYYKTLFSEPYPARSFIGVTSLPKNALLEIEVVAIKE